MWEQYGVCWKYLWPCRKLIGLRWARGDNGREWDAARCWERHQPDKRTSRINQCWSFSPLLNHPHCLITLTPSHLLISSQGLIREQGTGRRSRTEKKSSENTTKQNTYLTRANNFLVRGWLLYDSAAVIWFNCDAAACMASPGLSRVRKHKQEFTSLNRNKLRGN